MIDKMKTIIGLNNVKSALENQSNIPMVETIGHGHQPVVGQIVARPETEEEKRLREAKEAQRASELERAEANRRIRENGRIARRMAKEANKAAEAERAKARAEKADKKAKIKAEEAKVEAEAAEIRRSTKVEFREKAAGYSVRSYTTDEIWRDFNSPVSLLSVKNLLSYKDVCKDSKELEEGRALLEKFKKAVLDAKLSVRYGCGHTIRLNRSAVSDVVGVDYDADELERNIAVFEHGIQSFFRIPWILFDDDFSKAIAKMEELQRQFEEKLVFEGITVLEKNKPTKRFGVVAASSSHQKKEAFLAVESSTIKKNAKFFWFGNNSAEEFAKSTTCTGAEFLKARANWLRPWMKQFEAASGEKLTIWDILFVPDVTKHVTIKHGRKVGKINGKLVTDGEFEEDRTIFDGQIVSLIKLLNQGQCSSIGLKGLLVDGTSSVVFIVDKHEMTYEEFMNMSIKGADGKMHRVGDFKAIAGVGVLKTLKMFSGDIEAYFSWLKEMADIYPGIDALYLLRQAEEIEEEDKIRRLTKSLIQQWIMMSAAEIRELTLRARQHLKKQKCFEESVKKLAGLFKEEGERSDVERFFEEAPWMIMNPIVQDYLQEKWDREKVEAASGKFRTIGQYPYIVEDPVAFFEVYVLGMSPDDPTLGVLKGDEVSCADVPDGKELLCVRFPANFLTARVMMNRACIKAFNSVNNFMVLSVHSLILIIQDGDVDGDEMFVIYDALAIKLTKKMLEKYNPPVILFAHGSKAKPGEYKSIKDFMSAVSNALYDAKKYDKIGIYANLSMLSAYIASVSEARGDVKKRDKALLWMAVTSTGAIMAIDQVKGNQIDIDLVKVIDNIQEWVRGELKKIGLDLGLSYKDAKGCDSTYNAIYNDIMKRRFMNPGRYLPYCADNFLDEITSFILRDVGTWKNYNDQGVVWNKEAAIEALLDHSMPVEMKVKKGRITEELVDLIGDHWFKVDVEGDDMDATRETKKRLVPGTEMGAKELMLLLWRNESSMAYSMEGSNLFEKKEEYYLVVREIFRLFLESGDWTNKYAKSFPVGYVFGNEERWTVLANAFINDAFELMNGNGLSSNKGSYAMFISKVFATELRANVKANNVDANRFFGVGVTIDDLRLDIEEERARENESLFEEPEEEVREEAQYGEAEMSDEDIQKLYEKYGSSDADQDDQCISYNGGCGCDDDYDNIVDLVAVETPAPVVKTAIDDREYHVVSVVFNDEDVKEYVFADPDNVAREGDIVEVALTDGRVENVRVKAGEMKTVSAIKAYCAKIGYKKLGKVTKLVWRG